MSSWPLTSPSKPAGSRPPTRSAPAPSAAARVGRAFFRRHAALREGHELNVDPVAIGLAHTQHGFEIGEADVVVDVDVAAHARRAVGDQRSDERRGARFDRQRDAMAFDALGGDPLTHAAALDMGQTRRAPMRLVEMDVAVDERRQEERALKIDALAGRSALPGGCSAAMTPPAISTSARPPWGRRALARIIRRGSGASPPHIDKGGRHNA